MFSLFHEIVTEALKCLRYFGSYDVFLEGAEQWRMVYFQVLQNVQDEFCILKVVSIEF